MPGGSHENGYGDVFIFFRSDELGLDDLAPWSGFRNEIYGHRNNWGPVLDLEVQDRQFGEYYNPQPGRSYQLSFSWTL